MSFSFSLYSIQAKANIFYVQKCDKGEHITLCGTTHCNLSDREMTDFEIEVVGVSISTGWHFDHAYVEF